MALWMFHRKLNTRISHIFTSEDMKKYVTLEKRLCFPLGFICSLFACSNLNVFSPLVNNIFAPCQTEKFYLWRKLISCAKFLQLQKSAQNSSVWGNCAENWAKSAEIIKKSRLTCQLCSILIMIN